MRRVGNSSSVGSSRCGLEGGARRDDSLIGISTSIIRGPYKGYVGKIVNATHNSVRIELEAQCKTVTVSKQYIKATQAGLGGLGMAPQPAYGAPFAQPGVCVEMSGEDGSLVTLTLRVTRFSLFAVSTKLENNEIELTRRVNMKKKDLMVKFGHY